MERVTFKYLFYADFHPPTLFPFLFSAASLSGGNSLWKTSVSWVLLVGPFTVGGCKKATAVGVRLDGNE